MRGEDLKTHTTVEEDNTLQLGTKAVGTGSRGEDDDGNWEGGRMVAAAIQMGYQWRAEILDGRTLLDKIM